MSRDSHLNKSERAAYRWLLQQGVLENEVSWQKRRCPDFYLQDGRRYEVKALKLGTTIFFGHRQWELIRREPGTQLLLVDRDEVVDVLDVVLLQDRASWGKYRVVVKSIAGGRRVARHPATAPQQAQPTTATPIPTRDQAPQPEPQPAVAIAAAPAWRIRRVTPE